MNQIGVDEWETEIYNTYKELKLASKMYSFDTATGFIIPIRN